MTELIKNKTVPKKKRAPAKKKRAGKLLVKKEDKLPEVMPPPPLFTPESLVSFFRRNHSPAMIAMEHGISQAKLIQLVKGDPALTEAYELGMTILRGNYDKTLYQAAMGIPIKYKDPKGEEKIMKPNPVLLMFMGKTRFGLRETDPTVSLTNNINKSADEGANTPIQIIFSKEEENI